MIPPSFTDIMLTIQSFSICHGPTPKERTLMQDWIKILVAFVNDEEYNFGTKTLQEMKVATARGEIEIQGDERWEELLRISEVFSG